MKPKLYKIFDSVEAAEWDLSSQTLKKNIMGELECSLEEAERLLGFFVTMHSLDELLENESDEFASDNGAFEDELIRMTGHGDLQRIINGMLKELKPWESLILVLRYGLADGKERTLEEIGKMLSVTRERIRQIEVDGIRKLRHSSRSNRIRYFY